MRKRSQDKASAELVGKWWKQFKKDRDPKPRNRLVEHYLPIVKSIAESLHAKLPEEVDVDDLISAGIFGLIDALEVFDESRGVKFETYCSPRIRGGILDELRSMDWVPRLVRSRGHKLGQATRSLEAELGRKPTERELAKRMALTRAEFRKLHRDAHAVGLVSLTRKWFETDSHKDVREIHVLKDKRSDDAFRVAEGRDLKDLVTRGLSRAERLIIVLYYFEEMTMNEIAEHLDLPQSRVEELHTGVLNRLKSQLQARALPLKAEDSSSREAALPIIASLPEQPRVVPWGPVVEIFLEEGNATPDQIAALLCALSDLHRALGGSGLTMQGASAHVAPLAEAWA